MQDPILDWLALYGEAKGFVPDHKRPDYDRDTDMAAFLFEKGRAFEAAVMRCLEEMFQVVPIADRRGGGLPISSPSPSGAQGIPVKGGEYRPARDPELHERTLEAMREGVEIIYQPVLWDPGRRTYGIPDLLVREDVLPRLSSRPEEKGEPQAPTLPPPLRAREGDYRYVVVDIKFTNLALNAAGMIGSDLRRKAQLLVYNRALGVMQGYEPPLAYLIGRSYKSKDERGEGCFDRLGPCDMTDPKLQEVVDEALDWARRVRSDGMNWEVGGRETNGAELLPNMSNQQDFPWHMAKKEIAEATGELTQLWRVTPSNRPLALRAGVVRFSDERCTAELFGLADGYEAKLRQIIEINRPGCPDRVRPARIAHSDPKWREERPLEFYVDFETVSDLDDDFSGMPRKGGQALIYMIGCGHMEGGAWTFRCFVCDRLTEECERRIIDDWHAHMAHVRARRMPDREPLVFHWSHAEQSTLNTAYNSASQRHPGARWPELAWYDFLVQVVREEPVVVKGALAFGLKAVAKAMHAHDLIQTNWTNGPGDGLGAMVGAWRCDEKARVSGGSIKDLPLMRSIEDYNEVDCRVMQEIVAYLRANH